MISSLLKCYKNDNYHKLKSLLGRGNFSKQTINYISFMQLNSVQLCAQNIKIRIMLSVK